MKPFLSRHWHTLFSWASPRHIIPYHLTNRNIFRWLKDMEATDGSLQGMAKIQEQLHSSTPRVKLIPIYFPKWIRIFGWVHWTRISAAINNQHHHQYFNRYGCWLHRHCNLDRHSCRPHQGTSKGKCRTVEYTVEYGILMWYQDLNHLPIQLLSMKTLLLDVGIQILTWQL